MKKVAVILSGCGVYDGAEIHEAVLTLLASERAGARAICAAPNIAQREGINHHSGTTQDDEFRNVLEESARIARGEIKQLNELKSGELDAVLFVGGFGVAKNLSSFAFDGAEYDVDPMIRDLIEEAHAAGKPLGFMCVAPILAAAVLGSKKITLTIGHDRETAAKIESRGAIHQPCKPDSAVVDRANKIVTTPAYMEAQNLLQAEAGINQLVNSLLQLCE
ncbi:MAG: isoprenoid biosynthesis glyoxalase ElbB [Verrucomicrobia bacterium]|nr:isoprenoid biosynthesis glyoxalase ElbB [Verrucomicrobiota bacterium]